MAHRLSANELREIDRDFPHQVELSIKRDGLARVDIGWMHR
jgi:hypothetical protein